jgi:dTDP-4-dehydrorhamnose reductase
MKQTIIVTGGSGLLALNWAIQMRDKYDVILCLHERDVSLTGVESIKLDLDSINQIELIIKSRKPFVVIHTAGLTSIEVCEKNPSLAEHVNVILAQNVAIATARQGIKMVHISTDHLFAGDHSFMNEEDPIQTCNVYAKTKAAAEKAVLVNPESLIIRTNFYCWGPSYRKSFSDIIISALTAGKPIVLFENVLYTPILAEILIEKVHDLLAIDAKGIFNIVSNNKISKYQFGNILARQFKLDESLIKKGLLEDNLNLVKRPLDMSLSNNKLTKLLGKPVILIEEQMRILNKQYVLMLYREIQNL